MIIAVRTPSRAPATRKDHGAPINHPPPNSTAVTTTKEPASQGISALSSLRCILNASMIWVKRSLRDARFSFLACLRSVLSCFPAISPGYRRVPVTRSVGPFWVTGRVIDASGARLEQASSPLLDALDPQQRAAVPAPRGPVCVVAGAGTGRTRAITYRTP